MASETQLFMRQLFWRRGRVSGRKAQASLAVLE